MDSSDARERVMGDDLNPARGWSKQGLVPRTPRFRIAVALAVVLAAALATALPASALTFSGVLRDRDGSPLAKQTVQLVGGSPGGVFLSGNTDEFGHFAVAAAPGSY